MWKMMADEKPWQNQSRARHTWGLGDKREWQNDETKLLLTLWSDETTQLQLMTLGRKRHIWDQIAEKVQDLGFNRTGEQCRTRLHTLGVRYRHTIRTGANRLTCPFFDELHAVFSKREGATSPQIVDVRSVSNNSEDYEIIENTDFDENEELSHQRSSHVVGKQPICLNDHEPSINAVQNNYVDSDDQEKKQRDGRRFKRKRCHEAIHSDTMTSTSGCCSQNMISTFLGFLKESEDRYFRLEERRMEFEMQMQEKRLKFEQEQDARQETFLIKVLEIMNKQPSD